MSFINKILYKMEERSLYNESPKLYTKDEVEKLIELQKIETEITLLEIYDKDEQKIKFLEDKLLKMSRDYFRY
jgi:hypothetical protein